MKKSGYIFLNNLSASIVVFLIALPLCLGIALGSNAPLFSGIIAGVIGGIVVGLLSGSALSVSGPAAGLIAVVILGIDNLGSFNAFLLASFIAGIFQIIFGFLRFGILGDFIPNSVIKGMLAAIGIILILKQIPHFVGYDINFEKDESFSKSDQDGVFSQFLQITDHISLTALFIGLISIFILLILDLKFFKKQKFLKFIPSPLIVVIVSSLINQALCNINSDFALKQEHLVFLPKFNNASDFFSSFVYPDWMAILNHDIWLIAITIALVASIETLLCTEATDKLDPLKRRTLGNRELKAQGVGNSLSALIGGLPITSVIVRSSANINADANNKSSTIMHGIWLMLSVILISDLLNKIPYSCLAAILLITGYKLTKPQIFKDLYKLGYDQLIPFIVTVVAILFTNLLLGVGIGIIFTFTFMIYSNFKSSIVVVSNDKKHHLVRLRKDVSFLNKAMLKNTLEEIPANSHVMIDVTRSDFIDKDVIEVINDFMFHAHLKKIKVEVKKNNHKSLHKLIKS
jgi:MFS superfamily sulfate permease-like transporter